MRFMILAGALVASVASTAVEAETIFGLTSNSGIIRLDSNTGTLLSTGTITGTDGDTLLGIDFRPATGGLYSVATDGSVYLLTANADFTSYNANLVSTLSVTPQSSLSGIDFNPVPDRLRIQSIGGQNLRANVDTGATLVDTSLTRDSGGRPQVVGAAYTNSVFFEPQTATQLFVLDTNGDTLGLLAAPNSGVITTIGALGVSFGNNRVGFDISGATGTAYANLDGGLYSIDLGTGQATFLFDSPFGTLRDISVGFAAGVPEASTWAMMIAGFGMVGFAARRRSAKLTTVRA